MEQEREDFADPQSVPPARIGRWLFAVGVGVGMFVGVLLVSVVISREIPVKSDRTRGNSREDRKEVMKAMEIRMRVMAGIASLAGTIAGIVVFRQRG